MKSSIASITASVVVISSAAFLADSVRRSSCPGKTKTPSINIGASITGYTATSSDL